MFLMLLILQAELKTLSEYNLHEQGVFNSINPVGSFYAVNPEGVIGALDIEEKQLVLIDDDGKLIKRVARKGQGPGELRNPNWIRWIAQERVFAVFDLMNRRLSKWTVKGDLLAEHAISIRASFTTHFLDGNTFITKLNPNGQTKGKPPTLVSYDVLAAEQKMLWFHPLAKPIKMNMAGGRAISCSWNPRLHFGKGEGFIAVIFPNDNRIEIIDENGKPAGAGIDPQLPRYPVSKQQEEAVVAERLGPIFKALKADLNEVVKPEYWPSVMGLEVDPDNRIWAFGPTGTVGGAHPFKVFDRSGKLLGEGQLSHIPFALGKNQAFIVAPNQQGLILKKIAISL